MEITGKVVNKPDSTTGVSNRGPWKKAYVVVRYEEGQYPKDILLSNMKDAENFERIRIGDKGVFKFDANVRESNGRFFCDLNCWSWKIEDDMPI